MNRASVFLALLLPATLRSEQARIIGSVAVEVPLVVPGAPGVSASTTTRPVAMRDPAPPQAPPLLASLSGLCFGLEATPSHRYSYEFCPFHNLTQREQPSTWSSFWGLLGVWSGWDASSSSAELAGLYTDGTECGIAKQRRTARVSWVCSKGGAYVLKNVQEPLQCQYRLTFASPEACGLDLRSIVPQQQPPPPAPPAAPAPAESSAVQPSQPPPQPSQPPPPDALAAQAAAGSALASQPPPPDASAALAAAASALASVKTTADAAAGPPAADAAVLQQVLKELKEQRGFMKRELAALMAELQASLQEKRCSRCEEKVPT
jgi:hypothetical protein